MLNYQEEIFKILANQKRLEILLLLRQGELNVTQMIQMLDLPQTNLSQHLAILREHGIVDVRKDGREMYYRLSDDAITKSIDTVTEFLKKRHSLDAHADDASLFPLVTDPVCGMRISKAEAYDSLRAEDKTVYFCASGCKSVYMARTGSAGR